jgi:outer membrane protein TolC
MSSPKTPFMSRSVFARPTLRAVNDCDLEKKVEALFKAGVGTQADFLLAQAELQKAELRLAEEKARTDVGGSSENEKSPGTAPPSGADAAPAERRETLRQLVKAAEQHYRSGNTTLPSVIRASNLLLEAELEAAKTKAERIALYEKMVENLRELEKVAEAGYKAGVRPMDDVLEARAARLKAEIQLAREKGI